MHYLIYQIKRILNPKPNLDLFFLSVKLYVNSRYAKPRFRKFGFEVLDTGNMYLIRSPSGLKLQWFHSTGMMVIETESSSNRLPTMGLCGRWSSSSSYDMMVSDPTLNCSVFR